MNDASASAVGAIGIEKATYNSLRDPHLASYFRRPAVRRQLLSNNIIRADNKLVSEMSSTAHRQAVTLAEKRAAYERLRASELNERKHRKSILDRLDALLDATSEWAHNEDDTTDVRLEDDEEENVSSLGLRHKSAPNLVMATCSVKLEESCEKSPQTSLSRPKSSYGHRRQRSLVLEHQQTSLLPSVAVKQSKSPPHPSKSSHSGSTIGCKQLSRSLHNLPASIRSTHRTVIPSRTSNSSASGAASVSAVMTLKYETRVHMSSPRRVTIAQQRFIGGTTVPIFDRQVQPNDHFSFSLRPHPTGTLSLVFMLDQICDSRLNACCAYKHRSGARFGNFLLVTVSSGRPCLSCQEKLHRRRNLEESTVWSMVSCGVDEQQEQRPQQQQHQKLSADQETMFEVTTATVSGDGGVSNRCSTDDNMSTAQQCNELQNDADDARTNGLEAINWTITESRIEHNNGSTLQASHTSSLTQRHRPKLTTTTTNIPQSIRRKPPAHRGNDQHEEKSLEATKDAQLHKTNLHPLESSSSDNSNADTVTLNDESLPSIVLSSSSDD